MPPIDVEALILKSADSGESSRRFTFFSDHEGKFSLVARGVKSKRGPHAALEPYSVARVYANLKPEADLGTLTRAETIERFPRTREDLGRLGAAAVLSEALDRAAQPRLENLKLYNYALSFFRALNAEEDDKIFFLLAHGLIRAAQALGLAPDARGCVGCGGQAGLARLDFEAGGMVCGDCAGEIESPRGVSLSPPAAELLRACATRPWAQLRGAIDDGPETRELVRAVARWISYHIDADLRSLRFLFSSEK